MKEFILKHDFIEYQGYYAQAERLRGVIAVIHGIGEHFGRYDHFAEYMASHGYSVYGIDLPGHGKSPGIRGQIGQRDEVYQLIDALLIHVLEEEPNVPLYLMGHSMGGNLALSYRLVREKTRVKGFLISSPWLCLANMSSAIAYFFSLAASIVAPNLTIRNGIKAEDLRSASGEKPKEAIPDKLCHPFITPGTAAGCFQWAKKILKNAAIQRKPVYLMHGSRDGICSVEGSRQFAAAAGKLCTYREWEGLKHELLNETCWKEVANELLVWLETQVG